MTRDVEIKIPGREKALTGQTRPLVPGLPKFYVEAGISDTTHLYPGMEVEVKLLS